MSEKIATREAYGKALAELGNVNDKVVVLDADLAGATAGDLLVQLLHDGGLALLVRLIGLKQQLAKLGGSACGKGVTVVLHFG